MSNNRPNYRGSNNNNNNNNSSTTNSSRCQFFEELGVCKYGSNCTKKHNEPTNSKTLLLPNFYDRKSMTSEPFDIVYLDIFQQMNKYGEILDMIITENETEYLKGNVYVKFKKHQSCLKAFLDLNNKWYNKKPVFALMTNITNFNDILCHPYNNNNKQCNKVNTITNLNECNLLHVKQPSSNSKREALLANYKQYVIDPAKGVTSNPKDTQTVSNQDDGYNP